MDLKKLQEKLNGTQQTHAALIIREKLDEANRTAPVLFSTETPILHWFGYLILSHDAGCMVMDRMNNNAPLLKDHDPRQQIGTIENCTCDKKERCGRADVRFSKNNPTAEIEYKDMMDGIRTKVSVGFLIRTLVPETDKEKKQVMIDGIPVFRAILWEPHEISMVSIEADVKTGVNRAMDVDAHAIMDDQTINTIVTRMLDEINKQSQTNPKGNNDMLHARRNFHMNGVDDAAGASGAAKIIPINETEIRSNETARINGIDAMVKHAAHIANVNELRNKAVNENWTVEMFSRELVPLMATRSVEIKPGQSALESTGIDSKDLRGFRLSRAFHQLATHHKLSGKEKEISDHLNLFMKRDAKEMTITVPASYLFAKRDLEASTFGSGGATVGTDLMSAEMIELLRNKTIVEQAGARLLSGLVGNVAIPKQSGGATAYWLAEGATGTLSDQAFAQVALTPNRLFAGTAFTKQFAFQSSIGVENFIIDDIQAVLKVAKDLAALTGAGAAGEPLGILNMTGLSTSVTFGAAATFAKMLEFWKNVATSNADSGSLAYITTPATAAKLMAKAKDSNGNGFVWENGKVSGYPAFTTNQMPSDKVLFGNFKDLIIGEWAGVDITVDPYTLAADGKIRIIIEMHCDIVARHAASFSKSTDSGAQ